jgi:hypothetical protein
MHSRYPGLKMVASLLKAISVVLIIVGLGVSFWFLLRVEAAGMTTRILSIVGIVLSIIGGVIIYALSDFFRCIMDIEANTRPEADQIRPSS